MYPVAPVMNTVMTSLNGWMILKSNVFYRSIDRNDNRTEWPSGRAAAPQGSVDEGDLTYAIARQQWESGKIVHERFYYGN